MKKSKISKNAKRLLALTLVLAYMCIATGCTRNDNNDSGSMAGTDTQTETGTTGNGTDNNDTGTTGTTDNTVCGHLRTDMRIG